MNREDANPSMRPPLWSDLTGRALRARKSIEGLCAREPIRMISDRVEGENQSIDQGFALATRYWILVTGY